MRRLSTLILLVAGLPLAGFAVGCGGPANVNVPALARDMAINDPNAKVVKRAEVAAVTYSLQGDPLPGGFTLVLPEGTFDETYAEVIAGIDAGATRDAAADLPTLEVRAIRLRGSDGQVDLVRPDPAGRRLHVVDVTYEFGHGWAGVGSRPYAIDPEELPDPLNLPPMIDPGTPTVGHERDRFSPDTPAR